MSALRLPEFLVVGAARCGTTWLYEQLQTHPRVFLPASKRPEPHFFLKQADYELGLARYASRYFADAPEGAVAGEASTSYLLQPWVPARIAAALPQVKLIALLRDPTARAYSNWQVTVDNGHEDLSFFEALRAEPARARAASTPFEREVAPHAYVERGRYYAQLQRYLACFPREQLLVLLHDDLVTDPASVWERTCAFLELDPAAGAPDLEARPNAARYREGRGPCPEARAWVRAALQGDTDALGEWLRRDLSGWLA